MIDLKDGGSENPCLLFTSDDVPLGSPYQYFLTRKSTRRGRSLRCRLITIPRKSSPIKVPIAVTRDTTWEVIPLRPDGELRLGNLGVLEVSSRLHRRKVTPRGVRLARSW